MASSTLIGTAPDQVPTNGDLGDLAFQEKDSVEFYDGRGGLGHLDITAISKKLNVSANNVFIYDTSRDSDGGAWRSRCTHLSWYNETLNTAVRGVRRDFPSVAVLVGYAGGFTIYDGDDPSLPMWMVFSHNSSGTNYVGWGHNVVKSIKGLNAVLAVAGNLGSYGSLVLINLLQDNAYICLDAWYKFNLPITERNNGSNSSYWSPSTRFSNSIISIYCQDVTMTVEPNATVDSTGLYYPTIAVATNSGISVIRSNGIVLNKQFSTNQGGMVYKIDMRDTKIIMSGMANDSYYGSFIYDYITNITYNLGSGANPYLGIGSNSSSSAVCFLDTPEVIAGPAIRAVYNGFDQMGLGIGIVDYRTSTLGANVGSMYASIGKDFNSGWMPMGIKGAWLSDTAAETIIGSELVSNGEFSNSLTTGWTLTNTNIESTITNGILKLRRVDGSAFNGAPYQILSTIPGKKYRITYTVSTGSGANDNVVLNVYNNSSGPSGTILLDHRVNHANAGTYQVDFTAQGSGSAVILSPDSNNGIVYIDSISVRLAEWDRSYQRNQSLNVYGTINKTQVAQGADLVSYSNWNKTAGNYLAQTINSQIGTGDFFVTMWVKAKSGGGYQHCIGIGGQSSSTGFVLKTWDQQDGAGIVPYFYSGNGQANGTQPNTAVRLPFNHWSMLSGGRKNGRWYIYLNGEQRVVGSYNPFNITDTNLVIGVSADSNTEASPDTELALMRLSYSFPSDALIAKMFLDERELFVENAKATLYGSSGTVLALGYDKDTKHLHAGTSAARSTFNGLRRVDNTTIGVASSISAANGMVVEN